MCLAGRTECALLEPGTPCKWRQDNGASGARPTGPWGTAPTFGEGSQRSVVRMSRPVIIGSVITPQRRRECDAVLDATAAWAGGRPDVRAVAVVGSWARGEPRMDSDVDVIVVTAEFSQYVRGTEWIAEVVGYPAPVVRTMEWPPLTERRVQLASGFEVEFGFVLPSWATDRPVHPGTAGVVNDGCTPLVDPEGLIARLIADSAAAQ